MFSHALYLYHKQVLLQQLVQLQISVQCEIMSTGKYDYIISEAEAMLATWKSFSTLWT